MTGVDWSDVFGFVASVLAAIALVIVARVNRRSNIEAKAVEAETPTYASMVTYVASLTAEVKGLRAEVQQLRDGDWENRTYIKEIHTAWPKDRPFTMRWMPKWVTEMHGLPESHMPTPGSVIESPPQ